MTQKLGRWLLPTVLILFLLQMVLLPLTVGFTYSGRSETPTHTLTYTTNRLTWDSATGIRPDGSAELNLFDDEYDNVKSSDGANVIAPGTSKDSFVRLYNSQWYGVRYVAVLYELRTDERIPFEAELVGTDFDDAELYPMPEGIDESNVIRAVSGSLGARQRVDFDVNWAWEFEDTTSPEALAARDELDTLLANYDELPEVTVGLYIVVEANPPVMIPPFVTTPQDTEPVESEPVESEPSETEPSESEPSETEPSDTEPSDTKPSESESIDAETTTDVDDETPAETTTTTEKEPIDSDNAPTDENKPKDDTPTSEPEYITPEIPPETSDRPIGMYLGLCLIGLLIFVMLLSDLRRKQEEEECDEQ